MTDPVAEARERISRYSARFEWKPIPDEMLDAYAAAIRAATLDEVRGKVWPDGHLGSCPASTNVPEDGPEDRMWCDCGLDVFLAALSGEP